MQDHAAPQRACLLSQNPKTQPQSKDVQNRTANFRKGKLMQENPAWKVAFENNLSSLFPISLKGLFETLGVRGLSNFAQQSSQIAIVHENRVCLKVVHLH